MARPSRKVFYDSILQPANLERKMPPEESLQPNPLELRCVATGGVCTQCHLSHHGCPTGELL